jgi:catechol 2,3-dioxygenase-like lactoylglutathione lyase family enzyme
MSSRREFLQSCSAAVFGGFQADLSSLFALPPLVGGSGESPDKPLVSNIREVNISVPNLDEAVRFYTEAFGFTLIRMAELTDSAWQKVWRLPQDITARVALLRKGQSEFGGFRLIQFLPTSKVPIRYPYRPLDTSFVGCDMPVANVPERFQAMTARGWGSVSEIFTFLPPQMTKPVTVAVLIGPAGERLPLVSLTELQNDPAFSQEMRSGAPVYISFQVTEDIERDTALYTALGLVVVRDRTFQMPKLNRTVGLPEDAKWRSLQVSNPGETFGRVGLVQYLNLRGRNVSDRSDPPSLGIFMLSFRTRDMMETFKRLKSSAAEVICEPVTVENDVYGKTEVMTIKQPNGGWLEFYA